VSIAQKIKTLAVILTVAVAANAQFNAPASARVSSLAGISFGDISDVYAYPVLMMGYADHISATWGGGVIGIKALNDMISIGILANQGYVAPGFAGAATAYLDGYFGPTPADPGFGSTDYAIPHFLLGFDLGAIRLGADIFFEYAGYSYEVDPAAAAASTFKGSVVHPGLRLSGAFDAGDIGIMAKFGIGLPSINGEASVPGVTADKASLSSGLYMEMGAELGLPIGDVDWTFGGEYTSEDYRFKTGSTSTPTSTRNSLLSFYVGGEFNFMETAVAALRYQFVREATTITSPDVSGAPWASNPIDHTHFFSAALENTWDNVWVFDSFSLRGGALYAVEGGGMASSSIVSDINESDPSNHSPIYPILGFGVSKAFLTLDLALNMGSWAGVLTGPGVAVVTATVKF